MNDKEHNRAVLTKYLMKLIDEEFDKDDCDMKLIDRYNAILDEIDPVAPDSKRKKKALQELRKAYKEAAVKGQVSLEEQNKVKSKFVFPKWKIAVAVCLCLIIMTPIAASAFSSASPLDLILSLGKRIFNMEENTPYDYGELTFIRNGESKTYNDIKDCLNKEKIDILYPTWLPEGICIETVEVINNRKGDVVLFDFNEDSIVMSVELYGSDLSVYSDSPDYVTENYNGISCYTKISEENGYNYVVFSVNSFTYNISIKSKDLLSMIIKNMG